MPLSMTNIQVDSSGNGTTYVRASLIPSGSYPASGGDLLDMTALAQAAGCDQSPTDVFVDSIGGNGGYYTPSKPALNASFNNWALFAYASGGSQISNAPYPADTIRINAIFNKLL